MSRREFPRSVKAAAFLRANGHCEECTARLSPGRFDYDHVIPDGLGGEPVLSNCKVLCRACHNVKSRGQDVPTIAKMKRQRDSHIGALTATRKIQSRGFAKAPKRLKRTAAELARMRSTADE